MIAVLLPLRGAARHGIMIVAQSLYEQFNDCRLAPALRNRKTWYIVKYTIIIGASMRRVAICNRHKDMKRRVFYADSYIDRNVQKSI